MARCVVPFVVLFALLGGYVVGQQPCPPKHSSGSRPNVGSASDRALAARREHVRELEKLCQRLDASLRLSLHGDDPHKLCVAQTALELARVELAKAEGKSADVAACLASAVAAADRAVPQVRAAFEVGTANLADMLDALQTQADVKAALARLPK